MIRSTLARRQPTPEGDATTSRSDTTDHSTYHHQTPMPATDSRDHAIMRPTTSPPSPDSPPTKKPSTKSPTTTMTTAEILTQYFRIDIEWEYPLHEKYDLQDVYSVKYKAIVKANRLHRDDEDFNVDLPAFFVYHRDNQHWSLIKRPTSKYHNESWYSYIERFAERSTKQDITIYWYDILKQSCSDPLGGGRGPPPSGAAKLPWDDLH